MFGSKLSLSWSISTFPKGGLCLSITTWPRMLLCNGQPMQADKETHVIKHREMLVGVKFTLQFTD